MNPARRGAFSVAMVSFVVIALVAGWLVGSRPQDAPAADDRAALERAFAELGIDLDLARKTCSLDVVVQVRDELLEYVLTNPNGAAHESLFLTDVAPSELNAALLALGVEQGHNARWVERDPMPSEEQLRAGERPYTVQVPEGDGFYLYVGWREGDEVYFHRLEDLVRNLLTGRSMQRHRWVYLGSRMVTVKMDGGGERFAADLERNHVNIVFFHQGNTLVTAALEASIEQSIWLPNAWLLPPRGAHVRFVFARERLATLPDAIVEGLPGAPDTPDAPDDAR